MVVDVGDGARDLGADARGDVERERALASEAPGEALARDQPHHQVEPPRLVLAGVEEVDEVGVVQLGQERELAALPHAVLGLQRRREELERHLAPQRPVGGPVDLRRAAAAERCSQVVAAGDRARRGRRVRHGRPPRRGATRARRR